MLVAIPTINTLSPPLLELISFGHDKINEIIDEEYIIPVPKPVNTKQKGKTAEGKDCYCVIDSNHPYLPPIEDVKCICTKKCCTDRGNQYLPPEDCVMCPKCTCDTKTYTLINKESGHCPACRYKQNNSLSLQEDKFYF